MMRSDQRVKSCSESVHLFPLTKQIASQKWEWGSLLLRQNFSDFFRFKKACFCAFRDWSRQRTSTRVAFESPQLRRFFSFRSIQCSYKLWRCRHTLLILSVHIYDTSVPFVLKSISFVFMTGNLHFCVAKLQSSNSVITSCWHTWELHEEHFTSVWEPERW